MNDKDEKIRELINRYEKTREEIEKKRRELQFKVEENTSPPWMSDC